MSPTFAELGVPEDICRALSSRGITEPFEIQSATIADALNGRDVCGRAPTGSGKTLAFGIPLVATVKRSKPKKPRALVLAPTRELADQIMKELDTFSGEIRVDVVYGGVGYGPQLRSLRQGVDILVACPGRLEDLIEQGNVSLHMVDMVVLDEADRMADMGFMPAVKRLLDQTAEDRQTVLFSATLDGDIAKLTEQYQNNPARHEIGEETPDITAANHVFWKVDKTSRIDLAAQSVDAVWPSIIFCRTRHGSDRLAKQLGQRGVDAVTIHGGRSQKQRTRALAEFSKGRVQALVATDVAARGIHVDGVASVIHYDQPEDHKAYVHRSGRTARAGEGGLVVSMLMGPSQIKTARRMQRDVGLEEPINEADTSILKDLAPERSTKLVQRTEQEKRSERDDTRDEDSRPHRKHSHSSSGRHSGRSRSRDERDNSRSRNRDDRGPRSRDERDNRGPRSRDERPNRNRDERDNRGPRNRDERDNRGPRSRDDRDNRGPRSRDERDNRGPRSRDERPNRSRDERDNRGPRSRDDRDNRGPRNRDDRDDRDNRGPRSRDERPNRNRDDRDNRGPRSRDERPNRYERDDRNDRPGRPSRGGANSRSRDNSGSDERDSRYGRDERDSRGRDSRGGRPTAGKAKARPSSKRRGASGPAKQKVGASAAPNRKARRAHLQPGSTS